MSSGLPDFLTNIRPRYGGAQAESTYKVVTANDQTTLLSITGKGMVYGGFLRLEHTTSQKDSGIWVYVDDEKLSVDTFEALKNYGLDVEHSYAIYLRKCDETNFRYCVALSYGITFESKFEILYSEAHGGTPKVYCRVIYALM